MPVPTRRTSHSLRKRPVATPCNDKNARLSLGLRARFAVLLALLVVAPVVPVLIARTSEATLAGSGTLLDEASALRYRLRAIEVHLLSDEVALHHDELAALSREQLRALDQLAATCRSAALCSRLREHRDRWRDEIAPAIAVAGAGARVLIADEFRRVDETVHQIARANEEAIAGVVRATLIAAVVSLGSVVLVAIGVWTVFGRVRRLRTAAASTDAERAVRAESDGGDELHGLAGALADSLAALRAREHRLEEQQHVMQDLARDASFAESLASLSGLTEGAVHLAAGLRSLVPHDLALLSLVSQSGAVTKTWELEVAHSRVAPEPCDLAPPERARIVPPEQVAEHPCLHGRELAAAILVPLRVEGRAVGLLVLGRRDGAFTHDELMAAEGVAPVLATTIARLQLEARLRLSQQFAAVGGFSRVLAHEMRNPLNSMQLQSQLLQRQLDKLGVDAGDRLAAMRNEIARLEALVAEYAGFAISDANAAVEEIDLRDVVRRAIADFDRLYGAAGVALTLKLGDAPALAMVNGARLEHAIRHLVSNAVEAVIDRDERAVCICVERVHRPWAIRVRDNGPGIADPDRVFDPGYTTKPVGAGMGLSVALQIAEAHGGTIVARQVPEGGAEFMLAIPAEPPPVQLRVAR